MTVTYIIVLALIICSHLTVGFIAPSGNRVFISAFRSRIDTYMGGSTPFNLFAKSTDLMYLIPLSISSSSKTTTTNDPTAGMNAAEIQDYISNVGGGLCGAPEIVKTAIGLGLNLSLLTFGIFVLSYVILGGANFALEKQVEELKTPKLSSTVKKPVMQIPDSSTQNISEEGLNRSQKRLKRKLNPSQGKEKKEEP